MIRSIYFFFILLPFLTNAQNWKSFSDTAISFTAKYPSDWTKKIKEGRRVFFTSPKENTTDDFLENINIVITSNSSFNSIKIQDLFPGVIENIKPSFSEFKEEGMNVFQWNNIDAVEIIYSGISKSLENISIRIIQWFCFFKGKLITATYTAKAGPDPYAELAKKILQSIAFNQ